MRIHIYGCVLSMLSIVKGFLAGPRLGRLTITLSYSNERFKSQDTLDNITNEPISGGYEIPDHIIENLKKGNVPQASPFGIKASSTDLNGFTGENMDNLTGYEDYTNY